MISKTVNDLSTKGAALLFIQKNSFFVKTVHEWNQMGDLIVSATSIEVFRAGLSRAT